MICNKGVFRLIRHLKNKHGLEGTSLSNARSASRQHLLENKRKGKSIGTSKNPARICPVANCEQVLVRLDRHLKACHSIDKNTDKESYLALVKGAQKW